MVGPSGGAALIPIFTLQGATFGGGGGDWDAIEEKWLMGWM